MVWEVLWNIKTQLSEHDSLVRVPDNQLPIWLAAESHQLLLFVLDGESAADELFGCVELRCVL